MSTVTPLLAWNKGTNVLIFSYGLPVAAIFNFAAARGWGRFAAEDLAPVSHVHFPNALRGSGNVGVSKGSLHWSSTLEKETGGSMRQSTGSRREVPCWFSICLQMLKIECEVAADPFFSHQVWIWAENLMPCPMYSEQCEFQGVLSLQDFSFLEKEIMWLLGHEEQLVLFPALTPVSSWLLLCCGQDWEHMRWYFVFRLKCLFFPIYVSLTGSEFCSVLLTRYKWLTVFPYKVF